MSSTNSTFVPITDAGHSVLYVQIILGALGDSLNKAARLHIYNEGALKAVNQQCLKK